MSSNEHVLLRMLKDAKLDGDPVARKLVLGAMVSNKPELMARVYQLLRVPALKEKVEGTPFKQPAAETLIALRQWPFLIVGQLYERPDLLFFYPINTLAQHIFCAGAPGVGKTMWLNGLIHQLLTLAVTDIALANIRLQQLGLPPLPLPKALIIERTKRDFHWFTTEERLGVIKIDVRDLVYNPLQVPEGVPPEKHVEEVVRNFCKTNGIQQLGEGFVRNAVNESCEERGVFSGSDDFPTLFHVLEKFKSHSFWKRNTTGWGQAPGTVKASLDSLVVKLGSFLFNNERTYGASHGFPISQLAQTNFVLDVSGVGEAHARFLAESIVDGIFQWRWAIGERGNVLRNLIVVDEAKWLVPPRNPMNEGRDFAPIAEMMSKSREVGIGFVIADQTAHLDDTVFVNSAFKMCFRLGDGADIGRMQRHMRLDDEQADFIQKLNVREAIVAVAGVAPTLVRALKIRTAAGV